MRSEQLNLFKTVSIDLSEIKESTTIETDVTFPAASVRLSPDAPKKVKIELIIEEAKTTQEKKENRKRAQ